MHTERKTQKMETQKTLELGQQSYTEYRRAGHYARALP